MLTGNATQIRTPYLPNTRLEFYRYSNPPVFISLSHLMRGQDLSGWVSEGTNKWVRQKVRYEHTTKTPQIASIDFLPSRLGSELWHFVWWLMTKLLINGHTTTKTGRSLALVWNMPPAAFRTQFYIWIKYTDPPQQISSVPGATVNRYSTMRRVVVTGDHLTWRRKDT